MYHLVPQYESFLVEPPSSTIKLDHLWCLSGSKWDDIVSITLDWFHTFISLSFFLFSSLYKNTITTNHLPYYSRVGSYSDGSSSSSSPPHIHFITTKEQDSNIIVRLFSLWVLRAILLCLNPLLTYQVHLVEVVHSPHCGFGWQIILLYPFPPSVITWHDGALTRGLVFSDILSNMFRIIPWLDSRHAWYIVAWLLQVTAQNLHTLAQLMHNPVEAPTSYLTCTHPQSTC